MSEGRKFEAGVDIVQEYFDRGMNNPAKLQEKIENLRRWTQRPDSEEVDLEQVADYPDLSKPQLRELLALYEKAQARRE